MIHQIVPFGVLFFILTSFLCQESLIYILIPCIFYSKNQLTRGKVFINKGVAIVAFEWTKTIQSGERRLKIPLVNIPCSVLCPVNAYIRMC